MEAEQHIKIYIVCCRRDMYLLRCCIASIRYWNPAIPVFLLKDLSYGAFDTTRLEQAFNVSLLTALFDNLSYYIKFQPFFEAGEGRFLLMDADTVWLADLEPLLASVKEDVFFEAYSPDDYAAELNRWFFAYPRVLEQFPDYRYPGFLFNTGFVFFNNNIFSSGDFENILEWKNNTQPNPVFRDDQGIFNLLLARKIAQHSGTTHAQKVQIWGWSKEAIHYPLQNISEKKPLHKIIHWYGNRYGLLSFMPAGKILFFFENFYYSKIPAGRSKKIIGRLSRTVTRLHIYLYKLLKSIFKPLQ